MKFIYRLEIDGLQAISVVSIILFYVQITVLVQQLFKINFVGIEIF